MRIAAAFVVAVGLAILGVQDLHAQASEGQWSTLPLLMPINPVHIAVTYDGAVRKHYVDGELVASKAETGPMTTSASPVRLPRTIGRRRCRRP